MQEPDSAELVDALEQLLSQCEDALDGGLRASPDADTELTLVSVGSLSGSGIRLVARDFSLCMSIRCCSRPEADSPSIREPWSCLRSPMRGTLLAASTFGGFM